MISSIFLIFANYVIRCQTEIIQNLTRSVSRVFIDSFSDPSFLLGFLLGIIVSILLITYPILNYLFEGPIKHVCFYTVKLIRKFIINPIRNLRRRNLI